MKTASINTVREQTARLLATENITVSQDAKAPSAYFDLKTRTLVLPVWKDMTNSMYDMLVGHEVGHALFTPNGNGGWRDSAKKIAADAGFPGDVEAEATAQTYLNVVEDARIERLIKDRYPGLRRDFFNAYTEFAARDIFNLNGMNLREIGLVDRLNIFFKIGFALPVPFAASEKVFIQRMESAVTWEEVVGIAADLFTFKKNEQGGEEGEDEESEGEEGEGEESEGEQGQPGKGKSKGNKPSESEQEGEESESDSKPSNPESKNTEEKPSKKPSKPSSKKSDDGESDDAETPTATAAEEKKPEAAKTAAALDNAMKDLRDAHGKNRNYVYLPKIKDHKNFVIPLSQFIGACRTWESNGSTDVGSFYNDPKSRARVMAEVDEKMVALVNDTKSSILSFVREFEMLKTADEHRRTVESKSGRLDMDQAWKYQISDNLFRVATTQRDGKSHGFVMFVDWSGSMSGNMEQTMRQLYIMLQFCKKVGVPFDVYAFGFSVTDAKAFPYFDGGEDRKDRVEYNEDRNEAKPRVDLLHILSSRANARDIHDSVRYCLACTLRQYYTNTPVVLGAHTPLDSTIVIAKDIVNDFRKTTKVQIVNAIFLTDGDATDNLLYYGTKSSYNWGAITVLRDGHKEWADENKSQTGLLLDWFKNETGANSIGIYVADRFSYAGHHIDPKFTPEQRKDAEKKFKSDGWCSVPGLGFDEYFILRGQLKNTEEAMEKFETRDGSTMTPTQIKNAYMSAVETRNGARGMIHRMVKIVA